MKSLFAKYRIAIIILASVLALVLIRLADRQGFETDAFSHGMEAIERSNIIDIQGLNSMSGEKLVFLLDDEYNPNPVPEGISTIRVTADSIMHKKYEKHLRQKDKAILLYSPDISVSAAVWMVLAQTGIENIHILTADPENETLKYE